MRDAALTHRAGCIFVIEVNRLLITRQFSKSVNVILNTTACVSMKVRLSRRRD
jgi:hypothetical protein